MCYRRGSWCHVRNNVPFFGWQKLISTSIKSLKVEIFFHGMHIFCFLLFCFRCLFEITSVLHRTFPSSFNVVRNPKSRFRNQTGLVIFLSLVLKSAFVLIPAGHLKESCKIVSLVWSLCAYHNGRFQDGGTMGSYKNCCEYNERNTSIGCSFPCLYGSFWWHRRFMPAVTLPIKWIHQDFCCTLHWLGLHIKFSITVSRGLFTRIADSKKMEDMEILLRLLPYSTSQNYRFGSQGQLHLLLPSPRGSVFGSTGQLLRGCNRLLRKVPRDLSSYCDAVHELQTPVNPRVQSVNGGVLGWKEQYRVYFKEDGPWTFSCHCGWRGFRVFGS